MLYYSGETYRTQSAFMLAGTAAGVLLLVILVLGTVYALVSDPATILGVTGLALAGNLLVVGLWVLPMLRLAHRVEIQPEAISFSTVLGAVELRQGELRILQPSKIRRDLYTLRHSKGTVALPKGFTGFVRVVQKLKDLNPGAKFDGV